VDSSRFEAETQTQSMKGKN